MKRRINNCSGREGTLTKASALLSFYALLTSCNYVPRHPDFHFAKRPELPAPNSPLRTDGLYLYTRQSKENVSYQQLRFYPDGKFFDGPYPVDSVLERLATRHYWARHTGYYRVRDSNLFMEDFIGSYVRWSWRFGVIEGDSLRIIGYKIRGHLPRKTGVPSKRRMTPSIPAPYVYYFHPDR